MSSKPVVDHTPPLPKFVTYEGAHELLGRTVGIPTLRYWVQARKLTAYRPGKRVLLSVDELVALVRASARPALPQEGR